MATAAPAVIELRLRTCVVRVDRAAGRVDTVFPDGAVCPATRADTPENRAQAAEQGYSDGAEGVWRSLVEHEVAHSWLNEMLYARASPVLRYEAGAMHVPYYERLCEEATVIAFQRHVNSGRWPWALELVRSYFALDGASWARDFRALLDEAGLP